jgi:Flp pilus assembly pilin Flp
MVASIAHSILGRGKRLALRLFRRLARNSRGAALIEFALLDPAFLALLVAILQTGVVSCSELADRDDAGCASHHDRPGADPEHQLGDLPARRLFRAAGNLFVAFHGAARVDDHQPDIVTRSP